MKYPPSRMRGLRQMPKLQEGEDSRTYRVRAPDAVHEWLSGMTAEQRGELLAQVLAAGAPAEAGVGQGAAVTPAAPPRPAQGEGEGLRLSGVVPEGLSAYALTVVADLKRGGVLVEDGQVYRLTVGGNTRSVRGDTVYGLRRAGVLVGPES